MKTPQFITFGYWDNLRKGLLAGEQLHYDLRRMEAAYLDGNAREYELTKNVSLLLLDPLALVRLKESGACEIHLPESLFDADYPGHFLRRVKSISLTIPCVVGPYTSINCTLTLLKNSVRQQPGANMPYPRKDPTQTDNRFRDGIGAIQSIATSHGQNDSGLFELNFRDERYLPFECAGAISQWRLELPHETNAFDTDTISDVVLHLKYTARDGGVALKQVALAAREELIKNLAQTPLARLFSAKHEFPTEWYRFLHPAQITDQPTLKLELGQERFPFQLRGTKIQIVKMVVCPILKNNTGDAVELNIHVARPDGNPLVTGPDGTTELFPLAVDVIDGVQQVSAAVKPAILVGDAAGKPWSVALGDVPLPGSPYKNTSILTDFTAAVDDVLFICQYTVRP